MRDLEERTTDEDRPTGDATSDEIARSLGSVWQRFSGQRPKSTSVEMSQDVVRCVIEEATAEADADQGGETPEDPKLSTAGLKHNASAAITRITGRRVVAFISKRDKKTDVCTQTFHLDRLRQRF